MAQQSVNFQFLSEFDPLLVRLAANAEKYCFDDPVTALFKLRQLAEYLAKQSAAYLGVRIGPEDRFVDVLRSLRDSYSCPADVLDLFFTVKDSGNRAVHEHEGEARDSFHMLKLSRKLAVWFYRSFGKNRSFKPAPFVAPPKPRDVSTELQAEIERLKEHAESLERQAEEASQTVEEQAKLRADAEEEARKAWDEMETALSLAEEAEGKLEAEQVRYEEQLRALPDQVAESSKENVSEVVERAHEAAEDLDLSEADTRTIIDSQLRELGWDVDSVEISYKAGVRPQKNRNVAIAEWPTKSGPADYVLFIGLTPVAIVEAKRQAVDVPGVIQQAKRYSRDYVVKADEVLLDLGDCEYKVPFLFATNGRPYLKQIETKSGVWFLDARRSTNLPRALESCYSPEGLSSLLRKDEAEADEKLASESSDYLDLRDYQHAAIDAVEATIRSGKRSALLAMATGTGKTRTCIGLVYRLIKARRFNRVLFLVDRTALGTQATDAFKDVKLENLQSFTDIYDVKELGDITPDDDTRLHVATIQGMIKRILYPSENEPTVPVDRYDCIVIDECHRGYNLDREMSDAEMGFRSEKDYISKYSRVLDHFDAVKIGLTATPALHTTEIFGPPVYNYSYRQAVIDGWLCDHEPPIRITTALSEAGIDYKRGDDVLVLDTKTAQVKQYEMPDDVNFEVDSFNKRVITENFNRVVCEELAKQIDPSQPGKTLVFCATDSHADLVVTLLKEAFANRYGSVEDNAVLKITGASDKPLELIRRMRNERLPDVAVTVDLLTTGVDVPSIENIVFLRLVRSRILYEQMLGRATRLCPNLHGEGEDKQYFRIFDAVDLYSVLEPVNSMKPVVTKPGITFVQLVNELTTLDDDIARSEVLDQLIAKLQAKKRTLRVGKNHANFVALTGQEPDDFVNALRKGNANDAVKLFEGCPDLPAFLDKASGGGARVILSDHEDHHLRTEYGFPDDRKPEDFLEAFKRFIEERSNEIPALMIVTQRPRELTRKQLRELALQLDQAGFSELALQTAYRVATNVEITASIIGFIRQAALGTPLISYEERVERAMKQILALKPWTGPQKRWLKRIAKQLKLEIVVDRESLDHGQFAAEGGYERLNKTFDGKIEDLLEQIHEAVWSEPEDTKSA